MQDRVQDETMVVKPPPICSPKSKPAPASRGQGRKYAQSASPVSSFVFSQDQEHPDPADREGQEEDAAATNNSKTASLVKKTKKTSSDKKSAQLNLSADLRNRRKSQVLGGAAGSGATDGRIQLHFHIDVPLAPARSADVPAPESGRHRENEYFHDVLFIFVLLERFSISELRGAPPFYW
eukprot:g346.t1